MSRATSKADMTARIIALEAALSKEQHARAAQEDRLLRLIDAHGNAHSKVIEEWKGQYRIALRTFEQKVERVESRLRDVEGRLGMKKELDAMSEQLVEIKKLISGELP